MQFCTVYNTHYTFFSLLLAWITRVVSDILITGDRGTVEDHWWSTKAAGCRLALWAGVLAVARGNSLVCIPESRISWAGSPRISSSSLLPTVCRVSSFELCDWISTGLCYWVCCVSTQGNTLNLFTNFLLLLLHSSIVWSTLILSSYKCLGIPSDTFPSCFPTKNILNSLSSIQATCSAHFILFDLIAQIKFGEEYKPWSSSLHNFLLPPAT